MFYSVKIVANIVLELVAIRAACKVLDMRSNLAYATSIMLLLALSFYSGAFEVLNLIRVAVVAPLSGFVLPVAMSKGSLRSRIARTCLLTGGMMGSEFVAAGTYGMLTQSVMHPSSIDNIQPIPLVISYLACIAFVVVVMEIIIWFCGRRDGVWDEALRFPLVMLIAGTFFFNYLITIRVYEHPAQSELAVLGILVANSLTFAIALATLDVTQKVAVTSRQVADRTALVRRLRHIRSEISHIAVSSADIRHLKHDLANQAGVVAELVDRGHIGAADSYLAQLQERADALTSSGQDQPEDVAS